MPFQQYKHFHGKEVNKAARLGIKKFEKREFLEALPRVRAQAFKTHTILSGFSQCGINPFNPDLVINAIQKRIPEPPVLQMFGENEAQGTRPSSSSSSAYSPPKDIQSLRHKVAKSQRALNEVAEELDDISPKLNGRIQRTLSGGLILSELGAQKGHDLQAYLHAAKRQQQPRSRRQVNSLSSTGVLTVRDANRQIEARKAHEINKSWQRTRGEMDKDVAQKGLKEIEFDREAPGGGNILPVYYDGPVDR